MIALLNQCRSLLSARATWVSLGVLLVFMMIYFFLNRLERRFTQSNRGTPKQVVQIKTFYRFLKYILVFFTIIAILEINDVNVTSLITGLGLVGAIVGFALQSFLQDLIMGVNIRWENFFNIGDVIIYQNEYWEVMDITVKATKLRNIDTNTIYTISNRNFSEVQVLSDYQDIVIPGDYAVPAQTMRETGALICSRIEAEVPGVTKAEFHGADTFGDSSISYLVRVFGPATDRVAIRRKSNGVIQDVLAEKNIDIPFDQLDVHLKQ